MTATAANLAELEAALGNLLDTIQAGEKAVMSSKGLPDILQMAVVAAEFAKISQADTRYRIARRAVGYVTT